jgi:hypothetical protein
MQSIPNAADLSEVTDRALLLYEERLKTLLEPEYIGDYVAIHPDSGDYAIGRTTLEASRTLRERHPVGLFVTRSIGPEKRMGTVARLVTAELAGLEERK